MADIRIRQLPDGGGPVATDYLPIDNGSTRRATIQSVVETGRPTASQAEAEAGTNPTKAMTPLTVKQSIASQVGVTLQAFDAALQSIASQTTSADQMLYTTGSDAYSTTSLTPFARTILDDANAAAMKTTLGLAAIASSGSASDLTTGTVPNLTLPVRLQELAQVVTDWNTAVAFGHYFGAAGATNAPDGSDYIGLVLAIGGNSTQQYLRTINGTKEWVREQVGGVWGAWLPRKNDVTQYGAIGDGVTPAQAAFSLAATAAVANITTTSVYSSMPQTPTAQVIVPAGVWHLTADVVVTGKTITWICDEGAKFTSGSAERLLGKVVRPSRNSNGFPFGFLDGGTGDSVMIGQGSFDNSPLVSGFTNPNAISTVDTIDLVGRYTDATSMELLHTSTATFTATTCTLGTAVDVNKLRVGMVIQTLNVPFERGQVTSWNGAGTIITCSNGWYAQGTTVASTPASGSVIFNPFHKVWGLNTNTFLLSGSYGFQSTGHEIGVWNDKATPSTSEDPSGRTWGDDVVNLGPRRGSMAFLARGDFFEGFRATGVDIGYNAAAFASLGYATPSIGHQYAGAGIAYRSLTAAGLIDFQVQAGNIELGVQGVGPGAHIIDIHTGAVSIDYDSRILASGGDGTNGNGTLTFDAALTLTETLRPSADNLYQLGGASNRWTTVFATTGTINTSDERLKRFLDSYDKAENDRIMVSAVKAIKKLPIRLYQWNDSIEEKGDKARLHFGVSAQDVEKVFASEGLNAREFGLFCEDEDTDEVEVIKYVEVPEIEEVEEEQAITEIIDGKMIVSKGIVKAQKPKTTKVPMVYEDGSPVMKDIGLTDSEGNPVWYMGKLLTTKEPAFAEIPVMRKKEIKTYERVPNGKTRLGLRYDQLTLLMVASLRETS